MLMFSEPEGAFLVTPYALQRQAPLCLRFDHRPYWPTIRAVLGGTETLAAVALALGLGEQWLSYSRTARHYDMPRRYRDRPYTWRFITGAMDRLDEKGLIYHDRRPPGQRGWQSAAKAKPELCEIIADLTRCTPPMLTWPSETIVLRDANKAPADYSDTRATLRMRKKLCKINEGICGLGLPPTICAPLVRIFNRNFQRGGRLYARGGGWQVLSKEARRSIQIDGEPVVELDFSCLHPSLLYGKIGGRMPADAYYLPPWPRSLVKRALLILINASTRRKAQIAIAYHEAMVGVALPATSEALAAAERLIKDICALHHPITSAFGSDEGAQLMRLDSDIAEAVLLDLLRQGDVALPVHDSFIAPASKRAELERAMIENAERIAGLKLNVT